MTKLKDTAVIDKIVQYALAEMPIETIAEILQKRRTPAEIKGLLVHLAAEPRKQPKPSWKRWTNKNQKQAFREGWGIFDSDERGLEIQRDDEQKIFEDDDEALAHVQVKAADGSVMHQLALRLTTEGGD